MDGEKEIARRVRKKSVGKKIELGGREGREDRKEGGRKKRGTEKVKMKEGERSKPTN